MELPASSLSVRDGKIIKRFETKDHAGRSRSDGAIEAALAAK